MAEYSKVGPWVNGGAPAISAANLDILETQYELIKSEDLTFAGVKQFSGTILMAADLQHIGDTDTKITFTADAISLETGASSRVDLSNSGVRLGGANARVTTILDEDAMGSDSATVLCTQQSIKAYADTFGKIVFIDTSVFSGSSPAAWADLDLSGTIGSQTTLVLLVHHNTHGSTSCQVKFRTNGDGVAYGYDGVGAEIAAIAANSRSTLLVKTDASGVVEWESAASIADQVIRVIAYMKVG